MSYEPSPCDYCHAPWEKPLFLRGTWPCQSNYLSSRRMREIFWKPSWGALPYWAPPPRSIGDVWRPKASYRRPDGVIEIPIVVSLTSDPDLLKLCEDHYDLLAPLYYRLGYEIDREPAYADLSAIEFGQMLMDAWRSK
jgi:hypothetical protein